MRFSEIESLLDIARMSLLHRLRLRFLPPRLVDPEFGKMRFIYGSRELEHSYWEAEWKFPRTGTTIGISLPGPEGGPLPEPRAFCLSLPDRFEEILALVRPKLAQVFKDWLNQDLPDDIFSVVKLTGFGIDKPSRPLRWDVGFETLGDKWLYISIPFEDSVPKEPEIDT